MTPPFSSFHLGRFDRTPILIGIVILPLAASCALGLGVWQFGSWRQMGPEQRSGQEIRLLVTERDRRTERAALLEQAEQSGEQAVARLHDVPEMPAGFQAQPADVPLARILKADFIADASPPRLREAVIRREAVRGPPPRA